MSNVAIRWSGILLMIAAALMAIGFVMLPFDRTGRLFDLILMLSSVLVLLSLPAMYAKQANASGWLGLAGHGLVQTGMLLFVVALSPALRYPSYTPQSSGENAVDGLLALALALGLLLTAVATVRAGVFPRWSGILLLVGAGGFIFAFFVAELLPSTAGVLDITLLGIPLSFAWIGYSIVRGEPAPNQTVGTRTVSPQARQ